MFPVCYITDLCNVSSLCIYDALHPKYSITPFNGIDLEGEPSGYAENADNWIAL